MPVSVIVTACAGLEALRATLREVTRQAWLLDGNSCVVVNTEQQLMPVILRSPTG